MTNYVCTQCNNPVKQPHCRLQMPNLAKGVKLKANKFPCPLKLPMVKWEQESTPIGQQLQPAIALLTKARNRIYECQPDDKLVEVIDAFISQQAGM